MVAETDRLARAFADAGRPIFAFLDSHEPGKPEPPYPPHCERGTGEDQLVPELRWLEASPAGDPAAQDCINGFVGALGPGGGNALVDWVNGHRLAAIVVVGICTDVCVMDFVLTLLSARNHGLMPTLKEIVVYEPGCATYDLPRPAAARLGLPETAAHPRRSPIISASILWPRAGRSSPVALRIASRNWSGACSSTAPCSTRICGGRFSDRARGT